MNFNFTINIEKKKKERMKEIHILINMTFYAN